MPSFSKQQLERIIGQLDQAISYHDVWYRHLMRVIVVRQAPDPADLKSDAHLSCRFGRWYHSSTADFLRENAAFLALGDAHEKMHHSARILLQLVEQSQPISLQQWEHFEADSQRMRLAFRALRREFSTTVQNQDPLTEAQTRASLVSELGEQLALVKRQRQTCAIAMLDLDHFKRVNDEHGHGAGDQVLVATVGCIKSLMRPYDRIYRYGGEEFLISMPGTSLDQAEEIANRVRLAIANQKIPLETPDHTIQISASIGLAMLEADRSVEDSLAEADKAMYAAKAKGRNCVEKEALVPAD